MADIDLNILIKSTENFRNLLDSLKDSVNAGEISLEEYVSTSKKYAAELKAQQALLDALSGATQKAADAARELAEAEELAALATKHAAEMAKAEAAELAKQAKDRAAQEARDLAEAEELCALAFRHAAEMERLDAAEIAKAERAIEDETNALIRSTDALIKQIGAEERSAAAIARKKQPLDAETAALIQSTDAMLKRIAADDKLADKVARTTRATTETTNKMAGFGQTTLQTGRIVQDFAQGGIGGIINNLEGFAMALGLGAGVGGAAQLAGVAVLLLKDRIADLWRAISAGDVKPFADQITVLSERVKELQDKPIKLAVDTFELDVATRKLAELKRAQAEFDELQGRQTPAQAKSGKAVSEAITEAGAPEIAALLKGEFAKQLLAGGSPAMAQAESERKGAEAALADALESRKFARDQGSAMQVLAQIADAQKRIAAAEEKARAARLAITREGGEAEQKTTALTRTAEKGVGAEQVGAQADLARMLSGLGKGQVALDILANAPDRTKKFMQAEEDFKAQKKEAEYEKQEAAKRAAEQKARDTAADKKKAEAIGMAGAGSRDVEDKAKAAQRMLDRQVADVVAAFGPRLQDQLVRGGALMTQRGQGTDAVQARIRSEAEERLQAGGVAANLRGPAAAAITQDVVPRLEARIVQRQAELPQQPEGTDAREVAAGQVAAESEQAARAQERRRAQATQRAMFEREIGRRAGGQFTPEQVHDAADQAAKLAEGMGRFGQTAAGMNAAVQQAMQQQLAALAQVTMQLQQQQAGFNQLRNGFGQIANQLQGMGMTALNVR